MPGGAGHLPEEDLWRYYDPFARAASNPYDAYGEKFEDCVALR
jgi:hypothetical protein